MIFLIRILLSLVIFFAEFVLGNAIATMLNTPSDYMVLLAVLLFVTGVWAGFKALKFIWKPLYNHFLNKDN